MSGMKTVWTSSPERGQQNHLSVLLSIESHFGKLTLEGIYSVYVARTALSPIKTGAGVVRTLTAFGEKNPPIRQQTGRQRPNEPNRRVQLIALLTNRWLSRNPCCPVTLILRGH